MNNYTISDINNSKHNTICNQVWTLVDKHLVIIDKSIIEKLRITENNSTIFLEQEVLQDKTILMRIKKF
ncbi:MAG: hypothetical protein ACRD6U_10955 [Nitrososphaeraceae archaeon]